MLSVAEYQRRIDNEALSEIRKNKFIESAHEYNTQENEIIALKLTENENFWKAVFSSKDKWIKDLISQSIDETYPIFVKKMKEI